MSRTMRYAASVALGVAMVGIYAAATIGGRSEDAAALAAPALPPLKGEVVERLVAPPAVPAPIDRDWAAKVVVNLETVEKTMRLADGVEYRFWTFGGSVPGPMIRVREGDEVELHLKNSATSTMPHNIDMHAVTGPGGGAAATVTLPGQESVLRFRALKPGLWVYHCAMPGMVATHLANGMYGAILVEPKEGLPQVDREYFVMQSEIYTSEPFGTAGEEHFDFQKALDESPTYVVFNGAVGSLTGEAALSAEVGDRVRLFVANAGPNLVSSFHVIGEMLDNVRVEGGSLVNHDVQTTLIPAGGAAIAELRVDVPGTFLLVDHSIFRAMHKGAMAQLKVAGKPIVAIYDPEGDPLANGH